MYICLEVWLYRKQCFKPQNINVTNAQVSSHAEDPGPYNIYKYKQNILTISEQDIYKYKLFYMCIHLQI